ncbi:uncharacterized protein TNCV_2594691 [Trichonephila clavipes]|nr:uncharacterized protein TNCV_2594691 [Trichonephila clavipes]
MLNETQWLSGSVSRFHTTGQGFKSQDDQGQLSISSHFSGSINEYQAAVAEWYRYRTVACLVTGSSPVPLKTRRVGQRCTLNLSRAETSSRWCGVVVRRGGGSSGVVHVTWPWFQNYVVRRQKPSCS